MGHEDMIEGRLGPTKVVFSLENNTNNNLLTISKDLLTVQSQSAFSTAKANCCVFKGKWMYEVGIVYISDSTTANDANSTYIYFNY